MSFGPAKLFVGQIPRTCDENYVRTLFAPFGEVLEVYIMKNKATQENKGAAFVTFADMNAAQLAIRSLDQQLSIPPQTNPLQVRQPSHGCLPGHKALAPPPPLRKQRFVQKALREVSATYGAMGFAAPL